MVAGGGASVVYADTISDLGYGNELANYGEYSGDPSEALTYEYAKTILTLMTKSKYNNSLFLIRLLPVLYLHGYYYNLRCHGNQTIIN